MSVSAIRTDDWTKFGRVMFLALTVAIVARLTVAADPEPKVKPKLDAKHAQEMVQGVALFKKHIRPLFVRRCIKCHGGEDVESEFNMATRADLMKGGTEGAAVVLGKGKGSRLYKLVARIEEPYMPHEEKKLTDAEIAGIAKWIDLGAPYDAPLVNPGSVAKSWTKRTIDDDARKWWAFQPMKSVQPPRVANDKWSRTAIDAFVLAQLKSHGLTPNAPASKRKLIRRAYFDLIGLPPTAEQVQAFVNNSANDAYETMIDQLLASKHYGERWGRHWLDIARFGESHGFEQDYDRPYAYHFRDFVIQALNADMPFDQFVRWQLAGDEIAPDNPLAMMATGFLGAGVFPTQLTEKEFEPARYDALDDMAATMGTAMLGITIGCARCHDHKFDPIPQADYYRIISSFGLTIRSNVELDLGSLKNKQQVAKWDQKHLPLTAALAKFEKDQLPGRFEAWLKTRPEDTSPKPAWVVLDVVEPKSAGGATLTKLDDGSLLASGKNPDFDKYTFVANTNLTGITAIRLEALADKSLVRGGPGRAGNGNMGLGNFTVTAKPLDKPGKPAPVKLVDPVATFQQNTSNLSIAASIDGNKQTGWAVDPQFGKDHAAVFQTAADVGFAGGSKLTFTLEFNVNNKHNIGRPRLSISTAPRPVGLKGDSKSQAIVEILATLNKSRGKLTAKQRELLLGWYRTSDTEWRKLNGIVQAHLQKKPKPKLTKVMVASEGVKPIPHHADGRGFPHFYKETYFLKRGDTAQKLEPARQGFLQVLMRSPDKEKHWQVNPPEGWRTSYRRRSLANWITDTDMGAGQLLARVIVNRLWQHHLGRGIVSTPNDFGVQGQRPTHPELLDWLANRLIADGWQLKSLHKLIMTSAVYQQSSNFDAAEAKIDPDNKWLWRHATRRLEAEIIRDAMLAVSGQLEDRMFGAGTLNEGMKRRSIYFMIKRSKLIPMMQIFDSPEPLASVGNRPATTIAPQALMFMNNPHVRSYARSFAAQLATTAKRSPDDKGLAEAVAQGYLTATAREPTADELTDTVEFLQQQIISYSADKRPNAHELALADFCQVLMSLNEFVYVD